MIHNVEIRDNQLHIACSPVRAIFVHGPQRLCERKLGLRLTQAELPLEPFAATYARVTIIDQQGRRAWTNPIWLG